MARMIMGAFSLVLFISGCSHVMSEANLSLVDRSVQFEELNKKPEAFVGKTVLLGGIITGVLTSGDVTMLEVAQLELLKNEVPDEDSLSRGRFLAINTELIDPVIYEKGKLITIIGEVKGQQIQKKDGADHPYPLIAVKEQRLFRPSEPIVNLENPYQNQFGDGKFERRPPGLADGEPRRLY
ncbi:MAG TPA: Slp family lipoprotein [Desulfuromonadaceae bacterium]